MEKYTPFNYSQVQVPNYQPLQVVGTSYSNNQNSNEGMKMIETFAKIVAEKNKNKKVQLAQVKQDEAKQTEEEKSEEVPEQEENANGKEIKAENEKPIDDISEGDIN